MDRSVFACVLTLIALPIATAGASSLPATYKVVDLGPGWAGESIPLDRATSGASQRVAGPDGSSYAFPQTSTVASASLLNSIAPVVPAAHWLGMASGNPNWTFSTNTQGWLTADGLLIGQNTSGARGTGENHESAVFAAQRQADGSFGPSRVLFASQDIINEPTDHAVAEAMEVNKQGVILGAWGGGYYGTRLQYMLFDAKTGDHADFPGELGGWFLNYPISLDDKGDILTSGSRTPDGRSSHFLLLTPEGVAADPVATPEPSTLAVLVAAGSGWLVRRRLRGRAA